MGTEAKEHYKANVLHLTKLSDIARAFLGFRKNKRTRNISNIHYIGGKSIVV